MAPVPLLADAGDDQYAVAAGHYARDRWQLAIEEFAAYRRDFPKHSRYNAALFFQAEAHVQLGQFQQASDLFEQFLERDPNSRYHRQALFRWGESLFLTDDHAAAKPILEQFRQKYPKDKLNAYVLSYLGQIALASKDLRTAREHLQASLKDFPESHAQDECRYHLARIAEDEGDSDAAQRIFLALSSKAGSPWADDALLRLGALEYAAGNYEQALATFEEFESTFPKSALIERARLSRGWSLFQLDRLEEAEQTFGSLAGSEAIGLEARYWLGLTQKARKNWLLAAETLLEASRVDDDSEFTPAIVFHAGDALSRAGQREAAIEQFDRLLKQWPTNEWADDALLGKLKIALTAQDHDQVDALAADFSRRFAESPFLSETRRMRAQSLLARKQYEAAAEVMAQLKSDESDAATDQYLKAAAYQGLGRHEDALQLLQNVLKTADGQLLADARLLEAAVLVDLGRHRDAIAPLEAHLAADPDGPDSLRARAQLAACYTRSDAIEKARGTLQQFLEQQPSAELRHSAVQQVAEAAFAAGEFAWSAELFASLAGSDEPDDVAARALSGLAWSRYKTDELDEAAKVFGQLMERYPRSVLVPEAALVRGQVLERLKRPREAIEAYDVLLQRYPNDERVPQALLSSARLHDKLDHNEEAAQRYERFTKSYPKHESLDAAHYEYAWVLRELDRAKDADAQFRILHEEHRDSRYWADATFRLAQRAHTEHRYEESEQLLGQLVKERPDQKLLPHVLYLRGQTAAGLKQWGEVISLMSELLQTAADSPYAPLADYWIAEAHYRQGDMNEAGGRLSQLFDKVQGSREQWTAMVALRHAQVLAHQKKWKLAEEVAASISQRWPQFEQQYEADYVIGRALAARGQFDDARAAYQRVVRSEVGGKTETAAMAQWMIGESYFHQKAYEAALREYLRVEILYAYPTWQAAALLQAGKCSEHLGQWKQAAEMYERIVKDFAETTFVEEAQQRLATVRERLASR